MFFTTAKLQQCPVSEITVKNDIFRNDMCFFSELPQIACLVQPKQHGPGVTEMRLESPVADHVELWNAFPSFPHSPFKSGSKQPALQ